MKVSDFTASQIEVVPQFWVFLFLCTVRKHDNTNKDNSGHDFFYVVSVLNLPHLLGKNESVNTLDKKLVHTSTLFIKKLNL